MTTFSWPCGILALFLLALPAQAQTQPAATTKTEPDFQIGEMRIQTIAPINYLFLSDETTFPNLGKTLDEMMPELVKAIAAGKIHPTGPAVFIYRKVPPDPTKPFTLEIGFTVGPDAKSTDEFEVRQVPAQKCATILYSGPISHVKDACDKLLAAMQKAGLKCTGEFRECYLFWEGPDSPNNVIQIQMNIE